MVNRELNKYNKEVSGASKVFSISFKFIAIRKELQIT